MSTRELARRIGNSNGAVTGWEKGRLLHPLDRERVRALARELELDADALFGALAAEHFVSSLPEPLLRAVRRELLAVLERLYGAWPEGRGLSLWDGGAAGGGPEADDAGYWLRAELVDALAGSGHLDPQVARRAHQGGLIPAAEVELAVGRLLNPSQLADLLLILGATVTVDLSPRGVASGDLGLSVRWGSGGVTPPGET